MTTIQHDSWHEMEDIKQWLKDNDYKAERAAKVARYNELEVIYNAN